MDPETQEQQTPAEEAIETAAPEAVETVEAPEDPFAKGVAEANAEVGDPEPEAPVVPDGEDKPEADPKPEGPAVDEPKPNDKPEPNQPPKSVDDEIKDLGIKNERAAQRFRELSERAAEAEQYKGRASKADEWEQTIQSTGTNPEQFGAALNYLRAVNSGSPEAMSQAYDIMQKELQWLGEKLGREAPGYDPLSKHDDLKQAVANGEITKEAAAELAQHRQRGVLATEHSQSQASAQASQQAQQTGMAQVQALGAQLQASDPQFQQKFAYLAPTLELIQQQLPPQQWAQAIHNAYQRLPAIPAAPPAAPKPATPAPMRPSGAPSMQAKPKDAYEAFDFGVASANARGR